jgi:ADP-L-glycero-D-manno-heptose 6-epimerase
MYIVTGGAGFIGANLVAGLNGRGISDILVVDNLENSAKFRNLSDLEIADFQDKREFRAHLAAGRFNDRAIRAIFHQGACSDTMEYDGRYMMDNNFTYSKELFHFATEYHIPLLYASSAATYGDRTTFVEVRANENPLNVYGYSKALFDRYVLRHLPQVSSTVVGLRYFNVYGPREEHKGRMASIVRQLYGQLKKNGVARLFEGSGGYAQGEQRRDFIHVDDAVSINLFLAGQPRVQGIFNAGTGHSRSFNAIARTLIHQIGQGHIEYQPMPDTLRDKYQSFTEADISRLRATGFDQPFTTLEAGISTYVPYLDAQATHD